MEDLSRFRLSLAYHSTLGPFPFFQYKMFSDNWIIKGFLDICISSLFIPSCFRIVEERALYFSQERSLQWLQYHTHLVVYHGSFAST